MPKRCARSEWLAIERAAEARQDAAAAESWVHPADAMEGGERGETPESLAAELFARMLADTVAPPKIRCSPRLLKSGWHRWCAYAYRVMPDLYLGMSESQIAQVLGISKQAFSGLLAQADAAIRARRRPSRRL